ncbi:MAG: glutamate--tRNA ligase [Clostridiales bacterium]|nr:glutamate--tRNA ligase [Clostridiales bacterium]
MEKVRTRFAPSPTGFMHLGGLRTALYAYLYAKHNGGDFILRIEDTDQQRYVEGAVELIYSSLKESGLIYDEGPDVGGNYGPYVQSERKEIYHEYAKKLIELGGAYYCFCSKERLESLTDENGNRKYDKHCLKLSKEEIEKKLAAGEPYVIRQNIPTEGVSEYEDMVYGTIRVDYADLEDNILIKSDGMPTYNFANVIDDHLMGITHVIRGTEYLSSTPKYNLMYDAFGWERPKYIHLPTIMKDATRKLSKRYGDANFDDFVKKGYLKEAIINYVALLGWSPKSNVEKMTLPEMVEMFSLDGISKSPSIFDEMKLRWLNGEYIRELSEDEFYAHALPYLENSAVNGKFDLKKIAKLLHGRVEVLGDIPEKIDWLVSLPDYDFALFDNKKNKTDKEVAKTLLPEIKEWLEDIDDFSNDVLFSTLSEKAKEKGVKSGSVFWVMRIAITGMAVTPGGATEIAELLGKNETLARVEKSIKRLAE